VRAISLALVVVLGMACKEATLEFGTYAVTSEPAGARIYVNGRDTGRVTPATFADGPPGEEIRIDVRMRNALSAPAFELLRFEYGGQHRTAQFAFTPARSFELRTRPAGARVRMDGVTLNGYTPLELPPIRKTSAATITIDLSGHMPSNVVLHGTDSSSTVEVVLEAAQALEVTTEPARAQVSLDDKPVGMTPVVISVPLNHPFTLTVDRRGYKRFKKTFTPDKMKGQLDLELEELPVNKLPLSKEERMELTHRIRERDRLKVSLADARRRFTKVEEARKQAHARRALVFDVAAAENAVEDARNRVEDLQARYEEAVAAVDELRGQVLTRLDQEDVSRR
jgi:hypothetical protein